MRKFEVKTLENMLMTSSKPVSSLYVYAADLCSRRKLASWFWNSLESSRNTYNSRLDLTPDGTCDAKKRSSMAYITQMRRFRNKTKVPDFAAGEKRWAGVFSVDGEFFLVLNHIIF